MKRLVLSSMVLLMASASEALARCKGGGPATPYPDAEMSCPKGLAAVYALTETPLQPRHKSYEVFVRSRFDEAKTKVFISSSGGLEFAVSGSIEQAGQSGGLTAYEFDLASTKFGLDVSGPDPGGANSLKIVFFDADSQECLVELQDIFS